MTSAVMLRLRVDDPVEVEFEVGGRFVRLDEESFADLPDKARIRVRAVPSVQERPAADQAAPASAALVCRGEAVELWLFQERIRYSADG